MPEKIIALVGEEPVRRYFDVFDRSKETVDMVLQHVRIYDFDTQEEAEAFRMGVCAVSSPEARDFCEITQHGYKNLLCISKGQEVIDLPRRRGHAV
jgi:hypothetical protein